MEVSDIRDTLIGLANARYLDRPIFGGTTSGSTAFDSGGIYVGDTGTVLRTVGGQHEGPGRRRRARTPSAPGPTQLFTVLSDIATALRTIRPPCRPTSATWTRLASVLRSAQSSVGARYNQLTNDAAGR